MLEQSEKEGAATRNKNQMEGFHTALEECQLCDLGYQGPRFTWSNRRQDEMYTKERLDRAPANAEWCTKFQEESVSVLAARTSDHHPLHIL
jgi:hypothetical protein